jgi:hypothetical protein
MTQTHTDIDRVFFSPNYNAMRPYMVEAYKSLRFKIDANPTTIVANIISNYLAIYNEGKTRNFNLKGMLAEAEVFCSKKRMADFFNCPESYGVADARFGKLGYCGTTQLFKAVTCTHENKDVFAMAVGTEALHTSDRDCYETAGGYRAYKSSDAPIVYISTSHQGFVLHVECSLMVDHYNNNVGGLPTGGGTTSYKEGKVVFKRTISTGLYDLRKVCANHNLSLVKMDVERGKASMSEYYLG